MTAKKLPKINSVLADWFVSKPLKFAFMSLTFIIGILFFYFLLNQLFFETNAGVIRLPLFITVGIAMVYSVYKLIKWLPHEPLDRRSFVSIDNGLTLIYYIGILFSAVFFIRNYMNVLYMSMWMNSYSVILFVLVVIFGSLFYLYILGLMITNMYATYKRARFMGAPKWTTVFSFPFGATLLWLSGYILPEDKKTKPVISIKSKWFSALTKWVMSKQINAVIVFVVTQIFSFIFMGELSTIVSLLSAIIFIIWLLTAGRKKIIKSISSKYATFAMILNIIMIIAFILHGPVHDKINQKNYVKVNQAEIMKIEQSGTVNK